MKWIQLKSHEHRMELLAFIYEYKRTHGGWSPTMQAILDAGFYSSTSVVSYALDVLEDEGYIRRTDGRKSGSQMRIELPGERYVVAEFDLANPRKFKEIFDE